MRNEYPNPQFERAAWLSLNGPWQFQFDDDHQGHCRKYYLNSSWPLNIEVPFVFQAAASGIHDLGFHDHVWYRRTFEIPEEQKSKRTLLHIGACDYYTEVYVNSQMVIAHEGGHTSFQVDITDCLLREKEQTLVLYVYDPSEDEFIPRGKQYWKEQHESIWYPRSTGLWQPIWLEFVAESHLDEMIAIPDIDRGSLLLQLRSTSTFGCILEVTVTDPEGQMIHRSVQEAKPWMEMTIPVFEPKVFSKTAHGKGKTWSPEHPYLYDLRLVLKKNDGEIDCVKSYFGMRKIHIEDDVVFLNNRPYFQKLILDQGYYPTGLLTAPTDEDFVRDIEMAKAMGFNGCRKHQVVADPRFLYHADRLGYLVWGEMANCVNFNRVASLRMVAEWNHAVMRDINHPCIVAWVPINESWGVPDIQQDSMQQQHALSLYHLTKAIDPSRPVISNDGWEMVRTDLCAIHNYAHGKEDEPDKQSAFQTALRTKDGMLSYLSAGRNIYAKGHCYGGEPILLTEFGGIAYQNRPDGWGYTQAKNETAFLVEMERLFAAIRASECIRGYCYTQLTDVFQEENGLLTFDRKYKVDPNRIKRLNDSIQSIVRKTNHHTST
jgi:beta-galactosidase/beta-glucuronidase